MIFSIYSEDKAITKVVPKCVYVYVCRLAFWLASTNTAHPQWASVGSSFIKRPSCLSLKGRQPWCNKKSRYLEIAMLWGSPSFHVERLYTEENRNPVDSSIKFLEIGAQLGCCGSVDWALACQPKVHQFKTRSGHMSGLWVWTPAVGVQEETDWSISQLPAIWTIQVGPKVKWS